MNRNIGRRRNEETEAEYTTETRRHGEREEGSEVEPSGGYSREQTSQPPDRLKPRLQGAIGHRLAWFCLVLVVALIVPTVLAQSGGPFDLSWSSVDGGGGTSTGGSYTLVGAIGQADAGGLSGGAFSLNGGFLQGGPNPTATPVMMILTPTVTASAPPSASPTATRTPVPTLTPTVTPTLLPEGPNKVYLPYVGR